MAKTVYEVWNKWKVEVLRHLMVYEPTTPPPRLVDLLMHYDRGARNSRYFYRAASPHHVDLLAAMFESDRKACCIDWFDKFSTVPFELSNHMSLFPTAWWSDGKSFIYSADVVNARQWLLDFKNSHPDVVLQVTNHRTILFEKSAGRIAEHDIDTVRKHSVIRSIQPMVTGLRVLVE